ncbi:hypothetical protein [Streptomyces sp900116325]
MARASISGTNQFRYEPGGVIEFNDQYAVMGISEDGRGRTSFQLLALWAV